VQVGTNKYGEITIAKETILQFRCRRYHLAHVLGFPRFTKKNPQGVLACDGCLDPRVTLELTAERLYSSTKSARSKTTTTC